MVTAILLGKRGCVKALVGNTMVGCKCFKPETSKCIPVVNHVDDQICDLINTPDLYHGPKLNSEEEVLPQTELSFSGERVFLLILHYNNISPEETTMFVKLKETYGQTVVDSVIVVLDMTENEASTLEVDQNIQMILDECGGRVCLFKRGMRKDELNNQLLSTFKGMLQKNVPDRIDTTIVEPSDKTSGSEWSRPESAGDVCSEEKPGAAGPDEQKTTPVPKERKIKPNPQETLTRFNESMKMKMAQPKQTEVPPLATVAEGQLVNDGSYEVLGRCNHDTSSKEPIEKTDQAEMEKSKPTEGKDSATVPETHSHIYENIDESKVKAVAAIPEAKESDDEKSVTNVRPNFTSPTPTEKQPDVGQHHTEKDVLTIVLLGQTGSGKSATGNTILARRQFESHASSTAVTKQCEMQDGLVCGIKVKVVDTPDFFDEDLKDSVVHIKRCKELSQVQPVLYLLVMHMGRFTEGEREAASNIQKAFGEQVVGQTVVLFTGREKLKEMSLDDYIKNADPQLQNLVQTFGSRFCAFNNNDKRRHQVKELVKIVMRMPIGSNFKEQYKAEQKDCRVL